MVVAETLITNHIDLWTNAIKRKSTSGRGGSRNFELYGIKKLRDLILELAVRGLLVAQDHSDEPASELLKKIAAEKAKLIKQGKMRKEKPLPPTSTGGEQQTLKPGWSWTCMAGLGEISPRNEVGDEVIASFVPMPLISTRFDGTHDHEPKPWSEIKKGYTHFADGDVAIAKITPCFENSKAAIFSGLYNGVGAGTTELHVIRPIGDLISRGYLLLYLKSPQFLRTGESKMTGSAGQKRVPTEFFSYNPLPLPPLAEQHRIVAKVNELMELCNQIEQQTEASLYAHQTLVEALLNTLPSAVDHEQFTSAWHRIAEHFDILFTTEESVNQLKQTILQLAVMGKLVPQDPNDEPASELLKQIAAEKEKLVREGKNSQKKPPQSIKEEEKPFMVPEGWAWARLGQLGICSTGKTPSTKELSFFSGDIPFIGPGQISPKGELLESQKFLSEEGVRESAEALPEDLLMVCIGGSIGKSAIADRRLAFNQQINAIRPISVLSEYLFFATSTDGFYESVVRQSSGSATPIINRSRWEDLLVPICSQSEQTRIVAKVSELMRLCDRIKNILEMSKMTQIGMADSITVSETGL